MVCESIKCPFQCGEIDWLDLGFHDEPRDRIQVDADDLAAEPQRFDDGGAAAHEWIEHHFAGGIRVSFAWSR